MSSPTLAKLPPVPVPASRRSEGVIEDFASIPAWVDWDYRVIGYARHGSGNRLPIIDSQGYEIAAQTL